MDRKQAIEVRGLCKRYGTQTVVDHISFSVGEGELFSLLGLNGAGKSTTVKMLSCLTRPDGGDATLMGNSILGDAVRVKQIIGVSPQENATAPNLTVTENLALMAGLHGLSKAETAEKIKELSDAFSLHTVAKKRAKTLSGGWQRRLSIAMALVGNPKILFLDEPTLGLDVVARRELWDFIRSVKGKMTVILTTHYLEEAEALSDRIAVLTEGTLRAVGTPAELKAQTGCDKFEDAFLALAGKTPAAFAEGGEAK